jgi:hypothetical protein
MILPKVRDPRCVTIRRGGTLTDSDHHLLAVWAASCAEHVLDLFESAQPEDPRPRQAIEHARAWVRGVVKMAKARAAGGQAMAAARDLRGAARYAAYAAGQAGAVAHVAAHELGAAAYAIKAARAGAPEGEGEAAGRLECQWQRCVSVSGSNCSICTPVANTDTALASGGKAIDGRLSRSKYATSPDNRRSAIEQIP